MKKNFIKISVVIILLGLVLFAPLLKSDYDQFYERKSELKPVVYQEDIECFNEGFRKAVAQDGVEIAEDFVNVWGVNSAWVPYGMVYNVLTTNNEYLQYSIEIPQIENISMWILGGTPITEFGFSNEEIANDFMFYVDGKTIKLHE